MSRRVPLAAGPGHLAPPSFGVGPGRLVAIAACATMIAVPDAGSMPEGDSVEERSFREAIEAGDVGACVELGVLLGSRG